MIKRFWDKFVDPLEFFKLKSAIIMILMIVVLILDRR